MKVPYLPFVFVCTTAALATGCASQASRPQPLPDQKINVAEQMRRCAGGLERFLPGEYYFCEATRQFWTGRDALARENLKDAAAWASKPAQYALGVMYFNGDHAEANRPLGVAWLALAAERHDPRYEPVFVSAYRALSPGEKAQADAYWNDMKTTYADDFAAARASRRFDREYQARAWATSFGASVYVDGLSLPETYVAGTMFPGGGSFALARMLKVERDAYFAGYDTSVFVGDATMVPLSEVTSRPAGDTSTRN
jgi:hypothetical protein